MQKIIRPNVKLYRRHINIFWWANRWIHIKFIARELTSVCVAVYVIVLLFFVRSILSGQSSFEAFLEILRSPLAIALHILGLGGLVFHSITWFNLAPKAMVLKAGDRNVPGIVIALMNYAGWVVVSLLLIWIVADD
jgi:fumarate reductase subunit C